MKFRIEAYAHHGRPCPYCERIMRVPPPGRCRERTELFPTRDHVIPKSRIPAMGTVYVCRECNAEKGACTLPEWHKALVLKGDPRASVVRRFMRENEHLRLTEHQEPAP